LTDAYKSSSLVILTVIAILIEIMILIVTLMLIVNQNVMLIASYCSS